MGQAVQSGAKLWGRIPGKVKLAMTLKSEALPVVCAIRPRGIGWCGMRGKELTRVRFCCSGAGKGVPAAECPMDDGNLCMCFPLY